MALKLELTKLAWKTDEARLRAVFGHFGLVTACKVARDWETGRSRRRATITFADARDADDAMEALQGAEIDGAAVHVAVAPGQARGAPSAAAATAGDAAPPAAGPSTGEDVPAEDAADRAAEAAREQRREERRQRPPRRGGVSGLLGGAEDDSQTFG